MNKDHLFYKISLCFMENFYIQKCKWPARKPTFHHFKNEMRLYFETLKGLTNKKATRTLTVYKILFLNVYTPLVVFYLLLHLIVWHGNYIQFIIKRQQTFPNFLRHTPFNIPTTLAHPSTHTHMLT